MPVSYRLEYRNKIPLGEGWSVPGDVSDVLPQFQAKPEPGPILGAPKALNLQWAFDTQTDSELFINVFTIPEGNDLYLVFTCRHKIESLQIKSYQSVAADLAAWFNSARATIVLGFCEITSMNAQLEYWGREQKS